MAGPGQISAYNQGTLAFFDKGHPWVIDAPAEHKLKDSITQLCALIILSLHSMIQSPPTGTIHWTSVASWERQSAQAKVSLNPPRPLPRESQSLAYGRGFNTLCNLNCQWFPCQISVLKLFCKNYPCLLRVVFFTMNSRVRAEAGKRVRARAGEGRTRVGILRAGP